MHTYPTTTLYLFPISIADNTMHDVIPSEVLNQYKSITLWFVENARTCRQFLKKVDATINIDELTIFELDKHLPMNQLQEIESLMKQHQIIGVMSESGLPCIADPGNLVVKIAHKIGIKVKPFVGPSSILLALMASGFNGQNFKFNGYLPIQPETLKPFLLNLEKESAKTTQLFIEVPYRNDKTFQFLVQHLSPETYLLVAKDITGENEYIQCKTIKEWKKLDIVIGKTPCVFGVSMG
jgi:16S rRNA (cytidine1402-2'-O)-methyltransferase